MISTTKINKETGFYAGLLLGLGFPIIAYLIDFYFKNIEVSLFNIPELHIQSPLLWIVDLAPFVLGTIGFFLGEQIEKQTHFNYHILRKQKKYFDTILSFFESIGKGDYEVELNVEEGDKVFVNTLYHMRDRLKEANLEENTRKWVTEGIAESSAILRSSVDLSSLSYEIVKYVANYTKSVQGAFYLADENEGRNQHFNMISRYAYGRKKYQFHSFRLGEGLVGQCAFEKQSIHRTEIPSDFVSISSGLITDKKPDSLFLIPLISEGKLLGVLEFASFYPYGDREVAFLESVAKIIAQTIFTLLVNENTKKLLDETQRMAVELQENAVILQKNQEELKESNEQLEEKVLEVENQQKKLHALLSKSSEIITIYDKNLNITYQSPSIEEIIGYTPDTFIGKNDFENIDERNRPTLLGLFEKLMDNPTETYTYQYVYTKKDSSKIWLECTIRNMVQDPAIKGLVSNIRDITQRKLAEKEQAMRAKMQALSENSQDIIIRFDLSGKFLYVNGRLKYYTGIEESFVGKNIEDEIGLNHDIINSWIEIIELVSMEQQIVTKEMRFDTEVGLYIMQVNAIPEYDENKNLDTILFVSSDITSRKKQELLLEETNKKITDSINYARKIQEAIVPLEEQIKSDFSDFMMLYRPRDVVSGDFPWYLKKGNSVYVAVVDCTGHGVPGAMMSLIGYFLLNEINGHHDILSPSIILDHLDAKVKSTLKQTEEGSQSRDGMDVALCKIDLDKNTLEFAGANRPLFFVKNGELTEYKADKKPIGGVTVRGYDKEFTNVEINLEKGDTFYFFSDGLPDQFGGNVDDLRKFSPKRIREMVISNHQNSLDVVKENFETTFIDWMGNQKQIDDVLLIGIRY